MPPKQQLLAGPARCGSSALFYTHHMHHVAASSGGWLMYARDMLVSVQFALHEIS
jgi:hypothetical protein